MKFKVPMMYKVFLSYFKSFAKSGRLPFTIYHFLKPFLVPGLLRFKDLKNELQKLCDGHLILNNL